MGPGVDSVEAALAEGIRRASEAGEWTVVALLAKELETRRTARAAPNVLKLETKVQGVARIGRRSGR